LIDWLLVACFKRIRQLKNSELTIEEQWIPEFKDLNAINTTNSKDTTNAFEGRGEYHERLGTEDHSLFV